MTHSTQRVRTFALDRKFSGRPRYGTLGLDYFGARWYDDVLGRFLQPDSIMPHAVTAAGSFSSYTYDATGNVRTRCEGSTTYTHDYNVENRLKMVTVGGQTTTYIYNGDG